MLPEHRKKGSEVFLMVQDMKFAIADISKYMPRWLSL